MKDMAKWESGSERGELTAHRRRRCNTLDAQNPRERHNLLSFATQALIQRAVGKCL